LISFLLLIWIWFRLFLVRLNLIFLNLFIEFFNIYIFIFWWFIHNSLLHWWIIGGINWLSCFLNQNFNFISRNFWKICSFLMWMIQIWRKTLHLLWGHLLMQIIDRNLILFFNFFRLRYISLMICFIKCLINRLINLILICFNSCFLIMIFYQLFFRFNYLLIFLILWYLLN